MSGLQTAAGVRFTCSRGARFRRWPGAASTRARVVRNAPAVSENNDAERVGEWARRRCMATGHIAGRRPSRRELRRPRISVRLTP